MNFGQFFTDQRWWGKLIGAFFGYLMAGPVGAFFGILIGNIFDRGLNAHFSNPHLSYRTEKHEQTQALFLEVTFSVMGYLAKIDGRVSEAEITMASSIMKEMRLTLDQKKLSRHYFNQGKQADFNLKQKLALLNTHLRTHEHLLRLFIDIQFQAAQTDGLSAKKINTLNTIFTTLGFAPFDQQQRFYQNAYSTNHKHRHQQSSSSSKEQTSNDYALEKAYTMLQVKQTSNKQEVKKAYQRLISQNHPDKLIAKGMPDVKIKIANEKTQQIRKAYEQICTAKGW